MRYYTKGEVEQILHITPRQLQHLLTITGIMPTVASKDKRMHLIVNTDFERLKATHLEELRDYVPGLTNDESIMSEIEQTVIKMREEMDDLQRRVRSLETPIPLPYTPPLPAMRRSFTTTDEDGESYDKDGNLTKRYCMRLAMKHGVAEYSANTWRQIWPDDARVTKLAALSWARNKMGRQTRQNWHSCDDDDCPCHAID